MQTTQSKLPTSPTRDLCGWLSALLVGAIASTISPSQAAERISLNISLLEFGISVQELENFAKEERIGTELDFFLAQLNESDRQYVRQFLTLRTGFTAVQVSQFFYSDMGMQILKFLGKLVKPEPSQNGAIAIRTGLILAAADGDGLSLLNFLKKFPTSTIQIDGGKGLEIMKRFGKLRTETEKVVLGIENLAAEKAKTEPKIDPKSLPNLAQAGQYQVKIQTEILKDLKRNRKLTVDFYLPQALSQPAPAILLSHGLGSNRQHFAPLANFLASHGFIAAVLEHPGSNSERLQKLLKGYGKQVFDVSEFSDRPQDVSFVLDQLSQLFPGAVNVNQSGAVGHSFGGYTALALAGAVIDFDHLTKECVEEIDSVNVSLILQCEALKLPRQSYNFRDQRIKFAIAINPVDGSIFGSKGMAEIKIPVAIAASSDDVLASAVLEQIKPFSWLTAPERYLFVARGVGHVADIRDLFGAFVPSVDNFIPNQEVQPLKEYTSSLILALAQTHVANRKDYLPYLQASYMIAFSQPPNKVSVVRSLSPEQFNALLR